MKVAMVQKFGEPLIFKEMKIPAPRSGQILVKTEACGVCHTDLHAARGDWPVKPELPFIPGREGIGVIVELGTPGTSVKVGHRVRVPWLYSTCGHYEYCLSASETVCPDAQFGAYKENGGFAEYIIADPNYVAHIPQGLSSIEAAPLLCADITTYKGIKETKTRPGEWIAISGIGGLGQLAIQYAKAMGLNVCAVDIDDRKLDHAKKFGADLTFNALKSDAVEQIKKATGGGAQIVMLDEGKVLLSGTAQDFLKSELPLVKSFVSKGLHRDFNL